MKLGKTFYAGPFYLSLGWFPGEPFKLFDLLVLQLDRDAGVVFVDLQVARFCLGVGLR